MWIMDDGREERVRDLGRSWRTWRGLTVAERRTLAAAWLLLPVIGAGLRLFGFSRLRGALGRWSALPATGGPARGARSAEEMARLVEAAARLGPYRAACLVRALVLWWLLRRRGIPADLRIGVRLADDRQSPVIDRLSSRLQAHAWVEFDGVGLSDSADPAERFAAFDRLAP
jgi:Transglutaminase-like superfamily